MTAKTKQQHGIRDHHTRGRVADLLSAKVTAVRRFPVASACFTIHACEALSKELDGVESLQLLCGETRFI